MCWHHRVGTSRGGAQGCEPGKQSEGRVKDNHNMIGMCVKLFMRTIYERSAAASSAGQVGGQPESEE